VTRGSAVGVDFAGALGLGRGGFAAFAGVGLLLVGERLGLFGAAGVLAGGLLLGGRVLAMGLSDALGLAGGFLVATGFGEPGPRLDAPLVGVRPAAASDQERGQQDQQHHDDSNDHPSHGSGVPKRRAGYPSRMPDLDTVLGWRGKTVLDRDGEKVGTLGDLYLDRETDVPAYAGVRTGLFKRRESIVPLEGAREVDGDVQLPFAAERIHEAPNVDPDVALSEDEEDRLHEHYGSPTKIMPDTEAKEMVRSEEEVSFGVKPAAPTERVRLKKHVVVENVEKTVPVRREEIRVEHDPPESGRVVRVDDVD
jgi:hypothetical protein